jgi:hypothetical protein
MHPDAEPIVEAMGARPALGEAVEILAAEHRVSETAALELLVPGTTEFAEQVRAIAFRIIMSET